MWEFQASDAIAGLGVTPDGHVVVATGNVIQVLDPDGKATQFVNLPSPATTSPVVTVNGEILVGTQAGVVCLVAR